MLIASAVALGASLILSAETLQLARHPESALGCDLNSAVSCSAVAQSWQAEIVKFGGLSYPNAFFGIAAESVFVTIAVIGLARVRVPRWVATCTWLGGLAAHAVAVRDSRAVPVVPDPDVLHHHPVHGVEPCDRGRAGIAVT